MSQAKSIHLSSSERVILAGWLSDDTVSRRQKTRARIILLSADGVTAPAIAEKLDIAPLTIYRWRKRYLAEGIAGMGDRPRPGKPPSLSEDRRAELLRLTMQEVPARATRWSVRSLARHAGVSEWQVREAWRRARLAPHELEVSSHIRDELTTRAHELIGLFIDPPYNVACFVARDTGAEHPGGPSPIYPIAPSRRSPISLYRAFDAAHHIRRGDAGDELDPGPCIAFLRELERRHLVEPDTAILIDDNGAPAIERIVDVVVKELESPLHLAPMSASWLNIVEHCMEGLEPRSEAGRDLTAPSGMGPWRSEIHRYVAAKQRVGQPFVWLKESAAIFLCMEAMESYPGASQVARNGRCASIARLAPPGEAPELASIAESKR